MNHNFAEISDDVFSICVFTEVIKFENKRCSEKKEKIKISQGSSCSDNWPKMHLLASPPAHADNQQRAAWQERQEKPREKRWGNGVSWRRRTGRQKQETPPTDLKVKYLRFEKQPEVSWGFGICLRVTPKCKDTFRALNQYERCC